MTEGGLRGETAPMGIKNTAKKLGRTDTEVLYQDKQIGDVIEV